MMLDHGGHANGLDLRYDFHRASLKCVIAKIVDSTFSNVVNAGHDFGDLPDGLRKLHPYNVDRECLAATIMSIQRTSHDIAIKATYFLADLGLWLIHHSIARIIIVVGSEVVYDRQHVYTEVARRQQIAHPGQDPL